MEGFTTLFSAFGLASAAGFNAYIPLLGVGLIGRYTDLLNIAEPFDVLTHPWVLIAIGVLAVVDFAADKIPAVDHLWHAVGMAANPLAGAILFASQHNALTDVHPALAAAAGLVVAGGFHSGRAAVRPVATATTGGMMNPVLSFLEDVLSAGLSFFAIFLPGVAIALVLALAAGCGFVGFKAYQHMGPKNFASRPMIAPDDAIRARRRLTNTLIAAHDAARLRPFFSPQVQLVVGDGSLILGLDAVIDAFAGQFADPAFQAYVRTAERVTLDADGARAAEHGTWVGTWRDRPPMSGDYLAVWRSATGQWIIESELYVTLS